MILFTTYNCNKCQLLNEIFNLHAIGIDEIVISDDNVDALVELAWYGLVDEARKNLPILLDDDGNRITDVIEITKKIFEKINSLVMEKFDSTRDKRSKVINVNDCTKGNCFLQ